MLRRRHLKWITKYSLKFIVAALLFSITQCTFLPELPTKVDYDLSDDSRENFNISIIGNSNPANSEHLAAFLQVISDDLSRSGRFKVQIFSDGSKPQPEYQGLISVGTIISNEQGYLIDFELSLPLYKQKLASFQSVARLSEFREVAHRVSNNIFQTMLGVRGPFSTKLCFITVHKQQKHRQYGLWISDADGFNKLPLYSSPEPIMSPSWSPNGKKIAFIAFKKRDRQGLFVYDLVSKEVSELKAWSKGLVGAPSWSPNSEYMAFTYILNGNADIFVMNLFTKSETQLTQSRAIDTEAVWMPGGKSIIFTSDRSGTPQLYQINIDGTELTRVTYDGIENAQASVSPHGKNIAMIHKSNGHYRIAKMNRLSKHLQILTAGREDESPSFSPAGSMILYSAIDNNRCSLNIVSSNGKVNNVLAKFDDVRQPSWSPLF